MKLRWLLKCEDVREGRNMTGLLCRGPEICGALTNGGVFFIDLFVIVCCTAGDNLFGQGIRIGHEYIKPLDLHDKAQPFIVGFFCGCSCFSLLESFLLYEFPICTRWW